MRIETKAYLLLLASALVFDILFTMPPFLLKSGLNADIIYRFFHPVCHQLDDRSFHIFGYKLAVCSRCASIYYGATFGMIIYPLIYSLSTAKIPSIWILLIPFTATVVDFSLDYIPFLPKNTYLSRMITGTALGLSIALFIVPVFILTFKDLVKSGAAQHEK
ncbi:MAG: DUF2085 domain-containing protein [Candidatus Kryptoniota bacterium]